MNSTGNLNAVVKVINIIQRFLIKRSIDSYEMYKDTNVLQQAKRFFYKV